MGEAQQRGGALVVDSAVLGAGDQLVQNGEGVADRAPAGADHQRQHPGSHGDALLLAELLQIFQQRLRRHQPEGVVVRAGADGADDLVRLRGGEDELDVGRGLFDDLQQRVEAGRGDHMGLIDDEDLVAVADRGEGGALAQIAGIVHTAVAGGVDLDDVQ